MVKDLWGGGFKGFKVVGMCVVEGSEACLARRKGLGRTTTDIYTHLPSVLLATATHPVFVLTPTIPPTPVLPTSLNTAHIVSSAMFLTCLVMRLESVPAIMEMVARTLVSLSVNPLAGQIKIQQTS